MKVKILSTNYTTQFPKKYLVHGYGPILGEIGEVVKELPNDLVVVRYMGTGTVDFTQMAFNKSDLEYLEPINKQYLIY